MVVDKRTGGGLLSPHILKGHLADFSGMIRESMTFDRYKKILLVAVLVSLASLISGPAYAVEIYSVVRKNCEKASGPIVYVQDDDVFVLTYTGKIARIPRDEISIISRYQVQHPPRVSGVTTDSPVVFEAQVQGDPKAFDAFAIGFVENLVLFLDQEGRIRVIELESINSLRAKTGTAGADNISARGLTAEPVLAPSGFDSCHVGQGKGGSVATSDISDPFRVKIFLDRMRQGYRELENLAERTLFYARQLLFDRKNRLGITGHGDTQLPISGSQSGADFPIYFETGSGTPYRFQSSFAFGSFIPRMSPDTDPLFAVRSDFKSHLIHGSFVGNMLGLTAGKRLFIGSFPDWGGEAKNHREPWVQNRYNHLTLLGADYGHLTVSYGYYFPVFGIGYDVTTIEARPPNASPVFHAGYITPDWKIEGLSYLTSFRDDYADAKPNSNGAIYTEYGSSTVNWASQTIRPTKISIQSQTIKVLTTYDGFSQATMGADFVVSRNQVVVNSHPFAEGQPTGYEKQLSLGTVKTDKISSSRMEVNAFVRKDLGRSVALRGEASLKYETLKLKSESSTSRDLNRKLRNYMLALELLL